MLVKSSFTEFDGKKYTVCGEKNICSVEYIDMYRVVLNTLRVNKS